MFPHLHKLSLLCSSPCLYLYEKRPSNLKNSYKEITFINWKLIIWKMKKTSSSQIVTFFVNLIIVFIFCSFRNSLPWFYCQCWLLKSATAVLIFSPKHLKNTRKEEDSPYNSEMHWSNLSELTALLACIHYFAIFSWIQWNTNILKMGLISESRLKLTSCNTLTHLLQGTTQTLCFIFHHPFCLISCSSLPFFILLPFVTQEPSSTELLSSLSAFLHNPA